MASVKGESNINHLSLNNNETDIKIIVSGLSKVGKRSFLSKWINNEYTDDYKPSSFSQIGFKKVTIDDKKYNIGLWAISNNDDISIRTMGKNSNGLILICDNTNEDTLKEILELKNKYIKVIDCKDSDSDDSDEFPCFILQNKIDLIQQEDENTLKNFAKENKFINAFSISVKEGINVDKAMDEIIQVIIPEVEEIEKPIAETKSKTLDIKIILIGNSGAGKTSFMNKYTKNKFTDNYKASIVAEFGFKIAEVDSELHRIQMWDLSGNDKNYTITKIFAKDAHGVIVVCDATNTQTMKESVKWKKIVDETVGYFDGGHIPSVLVENKIDLLPENEREDDSQLQQFARENNFDGAFRTSSKEGININEAMQFVISEDVRRWKENKGPERGIKPNERVIKVSERVKKTPERVIKAPEKVNKAPERVIEKKEPPKCVECKKPFVIIVRGNEKTGKTSFISRFCKNTYSEKYVKTASTQVSVKTYQEEYTIYKFQFFDLAGEDKDGHMTKLFAKRAHGFVILCDATDPQSLEDTAIWKKNVDDNCKFIDGNTMPCILIENKIDLLSSEENYDKVNDFAKMNKFDNVFRVSCKENINVTKAMESIMKDIIKRYNDYNKSY